MKVSIVGRAGHGYTSDVRWTLEIDTAWQIHAYNRGHHPIVLLVTRKRPILSGMQGCIPTHIPLLYEEGKTIAMTAIDPLKWDPRGTCPEDGAVLWTQDLRANTPQVCRAEWHDDGWHHSWSALESADVNPELTLRERAVAALLPHVTE